MTPELIIEELLKLGSSEDRQAYVKRLISTGNTNQETLSVVASLLDQQGHGEMVPDVERFSNPAAAADAQISEQQARFDPPNLAADAAAAAEEAANQRYDEVIAGGGTPGQADAAAVAAGGRSRFDEPTWLIRSLGRPLTEDEKNRLVRHVRMYYGKDVRNWNDLLGSGYLDMETEQAANDVAAVVSDSTMVESLSMKLPSGRTFNVSKDQWETTRDIWARGVDVVDIDSDFMVGIVKLADRAGIYAADGQQPAWQPLGAWMKANGFMRDWATYNDQSADLAHLQDTSQGRVPQHIIDLEARGIYADQGLLSDPAMSGQVGYQFAPDYSNVPANVQRERVLTGLSPVQYFKRSFERGLEIYGNDVMAFIHASDAGLADRLNTPGRTSQQDLRLVARYFMNAGYRSPEELVNGMAQQGAAEFNAAGWGQFLGVEMKGETDDSTDTTSGAGAETRLPDPVGIDETLRQLYQQMFDTEPDEKTMAKFRAQVNSAVLSASESNLSSIDIVARARQFARQDPLYGELYGNRPGGMDEQTYKQMFESGQASMLGAERAGNVASRAGMRTGKYQTTIGAAAGTGEAWDNSTFLGRLARAANVVGANT